MLGAALLSNSAFPQKAMLLLRTILSFVTTFLKKSLHCHRMMMMTKKMKQ
jgi:hypothetical protein